MGRQERRRWADNDKAQELIQESRTRDLSEEEIDQLRMAYTGYGGLSSFQSDQHFTPSVVVKFIYDCLDIPRGSSIFEASCGAGAFLQEAPAGCELFGVELMQDAAQVARVCNPHAAVETGNALEWLQTVEGKFDFSVGNPPFSNLSKKDAPEGYPVGSMTNRLEAYFVELSYRSLKPGGMLAVVVPDGILANSKEQKFREYFIRQAWYRGTVSLPAETFKHSGTSCKTSIMFIQKPHPEIIPTYEDRSVFMASCRDIGWDSRRRATGKCDLPLILEEFRRSPLDLVRANKQLRIPDAAVLYPEEQVFAADGSLSLFA